MKLIEQIEKDVTFALKKGEQARLTVLRHVKAVLKNAEILKQKALEEADVLKVIQSEIKKRKESVEAFIKGGREELAKKEREEAEVLQGYLPKQFSDEELDRRIKEKAEALNVTDKKDFGKLMGAVMKDVGAQAEGNKVKERVNAFLEK